MKKKKCFDYLLTNKSECGGGVLFWDCGEKTAEALIGRRLSRLVIGPQRLITSATSFVSNLLFTPRSFLSRISVENSL